MIQCDTCGVWQHGECVSITQASVPEHYYCDICRELLLKSVRFSSSFRIFFSHPAYSPSISGILTGGPSIGMNT